jgi:hypothetical protein
MIVLENSTPLSLSDSHSGLSVAAIRSMCDADPVDYRMYAHVYRQPWIRLPSAVSDFLV